ncbi:MAG: UDP-N-acetylmuramate--L-alanine ligase [Patescibacteria group bacterium]|mgnify:CR=1 FL=1
MTSDLDLQKIKRVHFIGIGGIGISAIAHMMLLDGKIVSGSDVAESPITRALAEAGAKVTIGQKAENISEAFGTDFGTDFSAERLVVYTVAIKEDNPELVEVRRCRLMALTYPQMLAVVSREKFTIAVAGSHGKTTTTAMIAKILIDAGLNPTVIVGSLMKSSGTNFVIGKSKYFLVEACEYSRSFLNLHPNISVITNIDDDHLDYYGDIAGVQKGFREFAELLPADGTLVCELEGANMRAVVAGAGSVGDAGLAAQVSDYSKISDAEMPKLKVPGEHNVKNAKAALVVARLLGVSDESATRSLAEFSGTWRRFDFLGTTKSGTLVYDDYAHHPTEIRATLESVRKLFPDRKLTLIFQPHLYSRTKEHLEDFAHCFGGAESGVENLFIAPIYAAREPADPSISSEILAEKIRTAGVFNGQVKTFADFAAIEAELKISSSDIIMTMGAGDINSVALSVLQ